MIMVEVTVIIEKWGKYSKGDTIKMPESTALACAKSGAVTYDGFVLETEITPETIMKMKVEGLEELAEAKGIELSGDKKEKQRQVIAAYFPDHEIND